MANALLLDISLFLTAHTLTAGDGVDSFRDFMPETPDNLVVLQEYRGEAMLPYIDETNRSVQISVRDLDADNARAKALNIFKAFMLERADDGRVDLTPTRWGQVYLRQSPFLLKRDENNRSIYVFNIGITTTID